MLKTGPSIRRCDLVKWLFLVHVGRIRFAATAGPEFRSKKLIKFLEEHGAWARLRILDRGGDCKIHWKVDIAS